MSCTLLWPNLLPCLRPRPRALPCRPPPHPTPPSACSPTTSRPRSSSTSWAAAAARAPRRAARRPRWRRAACSGASVRWASCSAFTSSRTRAAYGGCLGPSAALGCAPLDRGGSQLSLSLHAAAGTPRAALPAPADCYIAPPPGPPLCQSIPSRYAQSLIDREVAVLELAEEVRRGEGTPAAVSGVVWSQHSIVAALLAAPADARPPPPPRRLCLCSFPCLPACLPACRPAGGPARALPGSGIASGSLCPDLSAGLTLVNHMHNPLHFNTDGSARAWSGGSRSRFHRGRPGGCAAQRGGGGGRAAAAGCRGPCATPQEGCAG